MLLLESNQPISENCNSTVISVTASILSLIIFLEQHVKILTPLLERPLIRTGPEWFGESGGALRTAGTVAGMFGLYEKRTSLYNPRSSLV